MSKKSINFVIEKEELKPLLLGMKKGPAFHSRELQPGKS